MRNSWLKRGTRGKEIMKTDGQTAEVEQLRKELHEMARDRDHWKANHDNRVAAAKFLTQRPDLPVERIDFYQEHLDLREEVKWLGNQLIHTKQALHRITTCWRETCHQVVRVSTELARYKEREKTMGWNQA